MSSRGVRRSGDKPPRRLSSNDRSLDPKGGCSNFGRQSNNSGNNNSPRSRNRNSGFRQRSSTADERRLRNGNSRKFYRNQQPKREAVSAGCFAPSTNSSKSGRNGRSGNNNTVKSEAALLPIEWRCRTPPQRHDEVR
jgi:ribosomal protein L34